MQEFIAETCLSPSSALHGNSCQAERVILCSAQQLQGSQDPLTPLKLPLVTETFRIIFTGVLHELLLFLSHLEGELMMSFHWLLFLLLFFLKNLSQKRLFKLSTTSLQPLGNHSSRALLGSVFMTHNENNFTLWREVLGNY